MPEKKFEDIHAFRAEAYRLYQLDWMRSHGYSPKDIATGVLGSIDTEDPAFDLADPDTCYIIWEHDCGFPGSQIWACLAEFLETEYQNADYMIGLLPAWMHAQYLHDSQNNL